MLVSSYMWASLPAHRTVLLSHTMVSLMVMLEWRQLHMLLSTSSQTL